MGRLVLIGWRTRRREGWCGIREQIGGAAGHLREPRGQEKSEGKQMEGMSPTSIYSHLCKFQ